MYQKGRNGFISREREQICMYKKGNLAGDMLKLVNVSLLQRVEQGCKITVLLSRKTAKS